MHLMGLCICGELRGFSKSLIWYDSDASFESASCFYRDKVEPYSFLLELVVASLLIFCFAELEKNIK